VPAQEGPGLGWTDDAGQGEYHRGLRRGGGGKGGGGRSIRSRRDVVSSRWRQGRNGGLWIAPIRMQRGVMCNVL
jgi:hypothetical protein